MGGAFGRGIVRRASPLVAVKLSLRKTACGIVNASQIPEYVLPCFDSLAERRGEQCTAFGISIAFYV